jgi:hypothetical protein
MVLEVTVKLSGPQLEDEEHRWWTQAEVVTNYEGEEFAQQVAQLDRVEEVHRFSYFRNRLDHLLDPRGPKLMDSNPQPGCRSVMVPPIPWNPNCQNQT